MKCIVKFLSKIAKVVIFVAGLVVLVKLAMNQLEKRGIIKTEWVVQKSPLGKGVRWVMSIKDKVTLSFQL